MVSFPGTDTHVSLACPPGSASVPHFSARSRVKSTGQRYFRGNLFRADLPCHFRALLELWFQTAEPSPRGAGWTNTAFIPPKVSETQRSAPPLSAAQLIIFSGRLSNADPEPQISALEACLFSGMPWGLVKPLSPAEGVNVQSQKWPISPSVQAGRQY